MIRVEKLTFHYGLRPVLRDLSLTIQTGELVVVLGPNGAGKSTLLGCIAGVLHPQFGHVEFDGVRRRSSVEGELGIRRRVAYLPDDTWLPGEVTGREYLHGVGQLYRQDDLRLFDHADRLLKLFHLESIANQRTASYSAGQRKKLGLAATLITQAECLVLDEPFSGGLDPAGIGALKQLLKHLTRVEGKTVVMSTPVPEIVEELAHRIVIIRDSTLVAYDTPEAICRTHDQQMPLTDALHRLIYPEGVDEIASYLGSGAANHG